MPGSPRKFGPSRSASADSAMPVVRSVRDRTDALFSLRARLIAGSSSSASMPRISRGTPGSIATQRPRSSSSQMPGAGAVTVGEHARALGNLAWVRFVAGNAAVGKARAPALLDPRRDAPRRAPSRARRASAIAGLVRSSLVGPSPPVVITAPVRSSASRTAAAICSASSPTVVRRTTSTPLAASAREMCAAFVSIVKPRRSSSPMVTSSTCSERHKANTPAYAPEIENERVEGEDRPPRSSSPCRRCR